MPTVLHGTQERFYNLSEVVSNGICALGNLQVLEISSYLLRRKGFLHLASVASLVSLSLGGCHDLELPPPRKEAPTFPAMRDLAIGANSYEAAANVVSFVTSDALRAVVLTLTDKCIFEEMEAGLGVFFAAFPRTVVQRLLVSTQNDSDIRSFSCLSQTQVVRLSTLTSLLSFTSLRTLKIEEMNAVVLCSDDCLRAIALALPYLEVLILCSNVMQLERKGLRRYRTETATFEGLLPLITSCRVLSHLRIPIKTPTCPQIDPAAEFQPSQLKTLELWIAFQANMDALRTSIFLNALFPSLGRIFVKLPVPSRAEEVAGWKEVIMGVAAAHSTPESWARTDGDSGALIAASKRGGIKWEQSYGGDMN